MTTNTETEATPKVRERKYDHDAIRKAIADGVSVKQIVEDHGCSPSLVRHIARQNEAGGARMSKNITRAISLRKKATSLKIDFDLISKWATNDDGAHLQPLIGKLEVIADALEEAAVMYEALPPQLTRVRRTRTPVTLEAGMLVSIKAKHHAAYEGLLSTFEGLKVETVRESHAMLVDGDGAKLLLPVSHLAIEDGGDEDGEYDDSEYDGDDDDGN